MLSVVNLQKRLRSPVTCVLPTMLDRQAERLGDAPLVIFDSGPTWSYAETRRIARGTAAALEKLGVRRGDCVLVWLPDSPMIVRVSLGLYYIGAIFVPLNTEYVGTILKQIIDYSKTELMIAHKDFVDRLVGIEFAHLRRIIVIGGTVPDVEAFTDSSIVLLPETQIDPIDDEPTPLNPPLQAWDVHSIIFTSGTTGVSKGVVCTHIHTCTMSVDGLRYLTAEDRFMSPCAYFHMGGVYVPWAVINKGAAMVVLGRFSVSRFWDQIRRTKTTVALLIGVMADFLFKAPSSPRDKNNPLRLAVIQPLLPNLAEFMERFGVSVYTQYDSSETPPSIVSDLIRPNAKMNPGYCGQVRPGFQVRLIDENDCEVPVGQPGELAVRCDVPWVIATEYFKMPSVTARAWRNGWFHTGDIFRRDTNGNYYFVDRSKDVIRRRGENISSFELEQEMLAHPFINAAAAYGVDSEFSENDVMITVEPEPGASLDPEEIIQFLAGRLPAFMVPRYVRIMDALPLSASDKITKKKLKLEGITEDTWDRDMSGNN